MSARKINESLSRRLRDADVYDEFCALMFDQGMRYDDLLEQLEEWGISSSKGALSRFSDAERSGYTLDRAKKYYADLLTDADIDLDKAQRELVAQRLFNLAASPNISEKALLKMRDQEIQLAMLENDRRRIAILEGKMQEASDKLEQLRDPDVGGDEQMRMRILDEVDRAMGLKK